MKKFLYIFPLTFYHLVYSQASKKTLPCYDLTEILKVEPTVLYKPHLDASKALMSIFSRILLRFRNILIKVNFTRSIKQEKVIKFRNSITADRIWFQKLKLLQKKSVQDSAKKQKDILSQFLPLPERWKINAGYEKLIPMRHSE